jgi:alkanesulfonate monooxygenase SsuD/methylene tetrahydromethanopterin reductase-like flavin-dependent oxidoreductase (luciferase family)
MRVGFAVAAQLPPEVVRACAAEAEALGYESFWTNYPGPTDGLAALAPAAEVTTGVDLGVGVVPLHVRAAASLAEGVRAGALPVDRLLLGIGSADKGALDRVRAGVEELRGGLGCRVVVAALGPRMCRLAGEVADGVLFNWLTPEHARRSAAWVREGAASAGREPPTLYAYVRLAVGADARERVEEEGGRYASIPAYGAHFERMSAPLAATAIAVRAPDEVAPALEAWRDAVDEPVLRALPAADTLEDHLALVRALRDG